MRWLEIPLQSREVEGFCQCSLSSNMQVGDGDGNDDDGDGNDDDGDDLKMGKVKIDSNIQVCR